MEPIFHFPDGLSQVAFFQVPGIQTWGSSHDREFKETVRQASGITNVSGQGYSWFVFVIRCHIAKSRTRWTYQIPDIENVPKLIVDSFTGLLYPDDNITYVRGVQVEGVINEDNRSSTEVWVLGMPTDRESLKHGSLKS